MREIETGVDDRHRYAGCGRLDLVVADVVDPPLVRNQRVARAEARERNQSAVRLYAREQTLRSQRRNHASCMSAWDAPNVQSGGNEPGTCGPKLGRKPTAGVGQLNEHGRARP